MEARLVLLRSFTNLLPESKNTRHDFRPDGSCGLLRTLSLLRDVSSPPFLFMFLPPFFITCVSTRLDKPVFSFGADDGCDSFGFEWLSTWMGSPAFCPPLEAANVSQTFLLLCNLSKARERFSLHPEHRPL